MKAIIEIPANNLYKYEINKETGELELDRVNTLPVPSNYGFIEKTLALDGDQLDVFVISEEPLQPLTRIEVDIIGGFKCLDNGIQDDKILAKIKNDPFHVSDVFVEMIKNYLTRYKTNFEVQKQINKEEALRLIQECGVLNVR